jgi:GLPGLI family protein
MKRIFCILCLFAPALLLAQPKTFTQAIITTKTTIVAPDDDENAPMSTTSPDGQEVRVMRFGGDGETKTTTWLKNDLMKTLSESEMGRTTIIRDNTKKITTTIMEIMGRKNAFYATDEDQANMRKRMDSLMQTRNSQGEQRMVTFGGGGASGPANYNIEYKEESKKISGYDCKKALIVATRSNGKKDTTIAWYTPDLKLQGVPSTGGMGGGFGGFSAAQSSTGFELLNGFPLQYERSMPRGRKMTVQVTKLVTDKDIADKEFEVPKDVELKAMKDMQNGGMPGTIQIRDRN